MFLSELFDNGLLDHVRSVGAILRTRLEELVSSHSCASSVRGAGLMQALVLHTEAAPINNSLLERGLLANATAGNILRFLPPFTITESDIDEAMAIVDTELSEHDSRS